jgi:hypothetical protein
MSVFRETAILNHEGREKAQKETKIRNKKLEVRSKKLEKNRILG